jgi:hypothetical protein
VQVPQFRIRASSGAGTANTVVARANAAIRMALKCILPDERGLQCTFNMFSGFK